MKVGEKTANASPFANDINLYASTPAGLRSLIEKLTAFFSSRGMSINVDKSFTQGFQPSGREKTNTVDIKTRFEVRGRHLRALTRTDEWRYLGVVFTWAGRKKIKPIEIIGEDLQVLTKAPLKSQQRLFALQCYTIPKLYHQLALGDVLLGSLKKADKVIRSTCRK